jgi:DNA-binding XRE family transcriptional regulator
MSTVIDRDFIKTRRQKLGLTQAEAATRAGLNAGVNPGRTWQKFESGEVYDPTVSTASAIAWVLQCAVSDFCQVKPKPAKLAPNRSNKHGRR